MQLISKRHRVISREYLLQGWSPVIRVQYEQNFRDGRQELQDRDLNARADGVTVLLHDRGRTKVILLRQARIVATLHGDASGETLEACSGMIDAEKPAECALREVWEEVGLVAHRLTPVASVYASPGGSLELIHLFTAEYTEMPSNAGGGLRSEGEEIELIELPLQQALALMRDGEIRDARTMLLLQHLALEMVRTTALS